MKAVVFALVLLLCSASIPPTADDPAKGHYESALFFIQSEKYQQALDDLNFIVKSFPQSQLADDALLQLGIHYLEREKKLRPALSKFSAN